MKKFESLDQLKQAFIHGEFKIHPLLEFMVNDVQYLHLLTSNPGALQMITEGHKMLAHYANTTDDENDTLVFAWRMNSDYQLVPYDVRSTDIEALKEGYKEVAEDRIIPDKVKVLMIDLPVANEIIGKVDTGADVCSLHAENIDVNRGRQTVSFDCPPLSTNRFTLPLADMQAIKSPSSDATNYRAVIKMNIKVAGKVLKDIEVNLNDRTKMEQPFLVGHNALVAGNFIVDPNIIKDNVEFDVFNVLQEQFNSEVVEENPQVNEEYVSQLYDLLENSDLTFKELIQVLRSETVNRFKDLEY